MEKCGCWEPIYNYIVENDSCSIKTFAICNGIKEQEKCFCNGDSAKCDFYPEKRKEKKMTTIDMVVQATKDGKTYKADDMRYNSKLGFHDIEGRRWNGDAFTYVNEIFSIDKWKLKPDNEMTKSEAEAKFNIKIVGD